VIPELAFFPTQNQKWVLHLIFVRIPKNASSSIYKHLGDFNLIKKYESLFRANASNPLYRNFFDTTHAKPSEIKQVIPINVNSYFSFAVVRNPWDRFVSMYSFVLQNELWRLFNLQSPPSFKEFCLICEERKNQNDLHFFPIQQQHLWMSGAFEVQKILRFENLAEDFRSMILEINASHISTELPHINSSDHDKYQKYYDNYTKNLVSSLYNEDIQKFNYTF
jgi:hypothetical protein